MDTQIETVSNEVNMQDVFKQRQSLHDSAWMLKEALDTLQGRLFPVIDARPQEKGNGVVVEKESEWHCELAGLLKEDADAIHGCLVVVRSIMDRLQI